MQSPEDLPLSDATAPPLTVASRAVPISTEPPAMVGESRREGIRRLRPATPDRRTCSKPSSCKTELRIYPPYLPEAGRDGKCPMLIERLQAVEDLGVHRRTLRWFHSPLPERGNWRVPLLHFTLNQHRYNFCRIHQT